MTATIRVLLVDDHPVVRDGLRGMLDGQDDLLVVGEAANGHQAVAVAKQVDPHVVLMDLRMPQLDGVAAIERLRDAAPAVKVLVLTTYDADARNSSVDRQSCADPVCDRRRLSSRMVRAAARAGTADRRA